MLPFSASLFRFQSTFPQGERPDSCIWEFCVHKVSIHVPARGTTGNCGASSATGDVSIHVPARGTTCRSVPVHSVFNVSIHVPARGTTRTKSLLFAYFYVSIHVPARGTTCCIRASEKIFCVSIHVPARGTTRERSRWLQLRSCFNPRSRKGNDNWTAFFIVQIACFNPRSRKGNDGYVHGRRALHGSVSIHVPARGTTRTGTETGTRPKGFNPRSRKGNDGGGPLGSVHRKMFQSTFPQGERLQFVPEGKNTIFRFNPRSRKGNDIIQLHLSMSHLTFQSTFPQGERQQLPTIFICSPCLYLCNYTNTSCSTQVLPPIIAFFLNFS